MKLILVRHGESKSNEGNRFTGQVDIPLSVLGEKQAENLKEYILKNYQIDKIYSSSLTRAYDTVKPIAKALNLPITKVPDLKEIDGGEWEEQKIEDLEKNYPVAYKLWRENVGVARCVGGEDMKEVRARALKALIQIAEENEGKTILIGTHAGVLRTLECYFKNIPYEEMKNVPWQANTSVNVLEYANGKFTVIKMGETEHLGSLITRLSAKI